jgi:uncharacterized glyoxalase superfamily protein PhnB
MTSDTTSTTEPTTPATTGRGRRAVWPVLTYRDAPAAIAFLGDALGFEERACYAADDDPSSIVHAQLDWPHGGGVMLSGADTGDPVFRQALGHASVYLVCDDPDALLERATAAGAEVARPMAEEDYGSRGFTVRDPEGNLWSLGTYAGE